MRRQTFQHRRMPSFGIRVENQGVGEWAELAALGLDRKEHVELLSAPLILACRDFQSSAQAACFLPFAIGDVANGDGLVAYCQGGQLWVLEQTGLNQGIVALQQLAPRPEDRLRIRSASAARLGRTRSSRVGRETAQPMSLLGIQATWWGTVPLIAR